MENKKLYGKGGRWDIFWEKENVTLFGRIMTKARQRVYGEIGMLMLSDVDSMLDVGSGYGLVMQQFKDMGYNVEGIDISPNSIEYCKSMGLNVRLQGVEDVKKKYDLVESEGMLEHFLDYEPYVKYLTRISKKYVMIMQPVHESFLGGVLAVMARALRKKALVYEYNYRMQDYIDSFKRYGFKNILNRPIFLDTWRLLVFAKE